MNSLLMLSNVFLFLFSIFLLFSILGNQLFNGMIYNRCRSAPYFNETLGRYISQIDFSINRLCSNDNTSDLSFNCPNGLYCVNFFEISEFFKMNESFSSNIFSLDDERLNETKFLNYGITNYDYITYATLNVFSSIRFQNWAKLFDIVT